MLLPDPAANRAALERQLAQLLPVQDHLHAAAMAPRPLLAEGWSGPAADTAERFLGELRAALAQAQEETAEAVRLIRFRLGGWS